LQLVRPLEGTRFKTGVNVIMISLFVIHCVTK
jgi:hypothetical protein